MELQPHKIGEIPTHLLGKNWCLGWMSSMTPYFFVVLHMFLTLLASGSRIEAFQFFLWFVLLVIFFTDSTMGWQSPLNLNHHLGNQSIQVVILVGWFHKTIMFQSKFWVEKSSPHQKPCVISLGAFKKREQRWCDKFPLRGAIMSSPSYCIWSRCGEFEFRPWTN